MSVGGLHLMTVLTLGESQARHEERLRVVEDAFARFLVKWEEDHDLLTRIAASLDQGPRGR